VDAVLIAALADVANAMMQTPLSFFFVGDPTLETEEIFRYPAGDETLPGIRMVTHHDKFLAGAFYPKCPIRRQFAEELSFLMLCVLWNHEFSHIFCGHIDKMRKISGKGDIWAKKLGYTDPIAWDFEVDADLNSILYLLDDFCMKEHKALEPHYPESLFEKLEPDLKPLILAIAILGTHYLWEILDFVFEISKKPKAHPSNGVRALFVLDSIQMALKQKYNFSKDDVDIFRKRVDVANDFYCRAWQVPSLSLKQGWSEESLKKEYLERVFSLRKTLRLSISGQL
jgi:hypothetical protein